MPSNHSFNLTKNLKSFIDYVRSNLWETKEATNLRKGEKPSPAPRIIKQQTLLDFASRYNLDVLVETGTYLGETVEAMKHSFKKIYSIELSKDLHEKARKRFSEDENVILLQGDSGIELEKVIPLLNGPALFWLDGHYSGGITAQGRKDTPVVEELQHILNDKRHDHVIIIDDARCFGVDPGYPSIDEISAFIRTLSPDAEIKVESDSLRIVPAKTRNHD